MGCKVEELIREEVPSLEEGTTVQEAARLMGARNVGSCVVTRNGEVVGLFTERDSLTRIVAQGRDASALTLGEVFSSDFVAIGHDSTCQEAVVTMYRNRCQRLFVYRGEQFLGLVKLPDLAYALASRGPQTNMLVNALGAVTFALAIGVVAMLLIQLPDLVQFTWPIVAR